MLMLCPLPSEFVGDAILHSRKSLGVTRIFCSNSRTIVSHLGPAAVCGGDGGEEGSISPRYEVHILPRYSAALYPIEDFKMLTDLETLSLFPVFASSLFQSTIPVYHLSRLKSVCTYIPMALKGQKLSGRAV